MLLYDCDDTFSHWRVRRRRKGKNPATKSRVERTWWYLLWRIRNNSLRRTKTRRTLWRGQHRAPEHGLRMSPEQHLYLVSRWGVRRSEWCLCRGNGLRGLRYVQLVQVRIKSRSTQTNDPGQVRELDAGPTTNAESNAASNSAASDLLPEHMCLCE